MVHRVQLRDVFDAYTNYLHHAVDSDYVTRSPDSKIDYSIPFGDRWFRNKGIVPRVVVLDDSNIDLLEFSSRAHYLLWLLRYS